MAAIDGRFERFDARVLFVISFDNTIELIIETRVVWRERDADEKSSCVGCFFRDRGDRVDESWEFV